MIINADARHLPLANDVIQCCVTSPPYFGLRQYGHEQQIGNEEDVPAYVDSLVAVFREVRRVLKDDGVCWVNLGDSYGSKKNLLGVPWRVAIAMGDDGWTLRVDNIWHKTSGLPESTKDRTTRNHEYVFMFVKNTKYYYNADAIAEPISEASRKRYTRILEQGETFDPTRHKHTEGVQTPMEVMVRAAKGIIERGTANKRSVWSISPQNYPGSHFATYPELLPATCILASSRHKDYVLDPFSGTATTGVAAEHYGRKYIGIELNPAYIELGISRLHLGTKSLPDPSLF